MIHNFWPIQIYKNQEEHLTTQIILKLNPFVLYKNINHVWSVESHQTNQTIEKNEKNIHWKLPSSSTIIYLTKNSWLITV